MAQKLFDARVSLTSPPKWLVDYISGGSASLSGEQVTPIGALKVTAVLSGFTILSEDTASLPLIVYERMDRGKKRAINSPYYGLLHDSPNPEMTSMIWREVLMGHLLGWGNHYSQMLYDRRGIVREIWPLNPARMEVFRDSNGQRKYLYTEASGNKRAFTADEILHIPAFGFDGVMGYSRISLARNAIGMSMSAERYGSKVFSNDARPSVVLKSRKALNPDAQARLRENWNQIYSGADNAGKTAVLEEDLDVQTIGFPPQDAQYLETRQFQVSEIARIFRIPPHMIGDVQKSTSWGSGIEQQELGYLTHTLRPWLVRIEQQIMKDLLLENDRRRFVVEHLTDAMLRTDTTSRYTAYAQAITNGWMTRNEARERENMNPIDGLDDVLVPLNMGNNASGKSVQSNTKNIEPLLHDVFRRIAKRESNELNDALKRWADKGKNEKYEAFLEQFFKRDLPNFMAATFAPMVDAGLVDGEKAVRFADFYANKRVIDGENKPYDELMLMNEWTIFEEFENE